MPTKLVWLVTATAGGPIKATQAGIVLWGKLQFQTIKVNAIEVAEKPGKYLVARPSRSFRGGASKFAK